MGEIRDYLIKMIAFQKTISHGKFLYSSIEEFVFQNGQEFGSVKKSYRGKVIRRQKAKKCFMNAYHLASQTGLHYVEGYGTTKTLGFPFLHAWCVDDEGNVYDPTWTEGDSYYGVVFEASYVMKTIFKRGKYGVIDNMEMGFPLLTGEDTNFREERG